MKEQIFNIILTWIKIIIQIERSKEIHYSPEIEFRYNIYKFFGVIFVCAIFGIDRWQRNHPEIIKEYTDKFNNFEYVLSKAEDKLQKTRTLLKNINFNDSKKEKISKFLDKISGDIADINENYNFRNFRKYLKLIDERDKKIDEFFEWLEEKNWQNKFSEKKSIMDEYKNDFFKVNDIFPSDFKNEVNSEIYEIFLELLQKFFFIELIIIYLMFFLAVYCLINYDNWTGSFIEVINDLLKLIFSVICYIFLFFIFLYILYITFSEYQDNSLPQLIFENQIIINLPELIEDHDNYLEEILLNKPLFHFSDTQTPSFVWKDARIKRPFL